MSLTEKLFIIFRPWRRQDEESGCKGKQFEGMDVPGQPPLAVLVVLGVCMCLFCVPGAALGLVCGCVCHPCAMLGGVLTEAETSLLNTIFMCSVGWMMLPIFVILFVLMMVWQSMRSAYELLQRFVCKCLPACPGAQEEEEE